MAKISNNTGNGFVYLVGAGPGDPGLITVKGSLALNSCDAVIYDNLVTSELIVTLPQHIERHYVGKKSGRQCCSQDEINDLMIKLAGENKSVVRLKGSDPLIFGRGGEEAKFLREHNIDFEIIPGVTAGVAVPAYSGIPCTDRHLASFVMFVTGHKARDKKYSTVPWEWIGKAKGGTIVIYMGVGEIKNIVETLTKSGMAPDTPAAIVERGTFPTQKFVTSNLSDLPSAVKEKGIKPPALFIIGEVVTLQPWLEWFKGKPLIGTRVMVTRAASPAQKIYEELREFGAEVLPYPTIEVEEYLDPKGWNSFDKVKSENRWLIFTSETGVRYFMKQFLEQSGDIRRLGNYKIAAIGKATAINLQKFGLSADFIPNKSTAAALGKEMRENVDLKNSEIIRVRGVLAADSIEKVLSKAGANVIPLTVYNTFYPEWSGGLKEKLFEYPPDVIIFSSGSTVNGLYENLAKKEVESLIKNAEIYSIGPSTSKILEKAGIKVSAEADPHNMTALINQMVENISENKDGRSE
ncbi:MAG: uroporphyrinogen-III C-methyltransferase [candidate division Zixibacteria bacterium]|nr:uroporphyrinogen-III C-methyltransferase [candidate division Zixibacteria bacterium]